MIWWSLALGAALAVGACTSHQAPSGDEPELEDLAGGTRDPSDSGPPPLEPEPPFGCGETVCPETSFGYGTEQCCTPEDRCGFFNSLASGECLEADQPGSPDEGCPGVNVASFRLDGCCREDLTCGVLDSFIGAGCLDPNVLLGVEALPRACGEPPPRCAPDDPTPGLCSQCLQRRCCDAWVACKDDLECRAGWTDLVECAHSAPNPLAVCSFRSDRLVALLSCVVGTEPTASALGDAGSADGGDGGASVLGPCFEACTPGAAL